MVAATVAVIPGTLTSVTPSGASPGVLVNLTGTGFSSTAAQNQVTFTPVAGGEPVTALAIASTTVDATRGVRRLSVRVPAGLPAGTVAATVLNTATGETSNAATFELVTIALPERASAAVGAQGLTVRITGSANAKFVAGSTRPAFGAGIAVVGTVVESATSLVATINVAATAAPGPRNVSVTTSTQSLLLTAGFEVTSAPSLNAAPIANPNGPYSGSVNEALTFSSAGSSDPDADPLTYAWTFGDGATSSDANPTHAYAATGSYAVSLTVSDGKGGTNTAGTSATIAQPNRPPQFTSTPVLTAREGESYSYQLAATDPDGDALTFSLVSGPPAMSLAAGIVSWTPAASDVGSHDIQVGVSDGRGGADTQAYSITVTPALELTGIELAPSSIRFTEAGASTQLTVTGSRSDQSTIDLTPAAAGTTYESSDTAVVTVSAAGLVTAVANGSAVLTARNSGFSDTSAAVVEVGVLLESLDLTPSLITLRSVSATAATTLRGSFSDGSVRDLTNAPGTAFSIQPETVATVATNGVVTAVGPGSATLTATHEGRSATAQVQVTLSAGTAFLRGEIFDDSKGIPLAGATATVAPSGVAATLASPVSVPADDRGRFTVPSGAGATLVRIERDGFTSVERQAEPVDNAVTTLLDARLTPLDGRVNLLQSVFGGQAASSDGTATLVVPPGSLDGDGTFRVTPISNQGLQGLLPAGWSPIAAVDLQPAGRRFTQAATLRLPHVDTLASGAAVAVARYDAVNHRWIGQPAGQVSADRRTVSAAIAQTGQYVFLVPDEAPFAPPPAVAGEVLVGLAAPTVPDTSAATGEVRPRSAPPGNDVRAIGTVILQPPVPLPSGAVLRARVEEQFDLLDTSRVRPLPFVQDLVLYARPRLGGAGTLATRLPITPTLQFTIQQLSLGQVKLDLTIDEPVVQNAVVGPGGGTLTDDAGDALEIPAGALPADVAIGLRALEAGQLSIGLPDGFTSLGGVLVDLVGTVFTQPANLSITRPSGLDTAKQIVVAQAITDITGGRRWKVVGLGEVASTRIGVQTALGPLTFEGVRSGGEYVFLQPPQPLGFVGGVVDSPAALPQVSALVSSNTAPFVFVTGATGTFIVAGRAGTSSTIGALDAAGATASAPVVLTAANETAAVDLTLAIAAPAVVAISPGANASNVPLDASVVIDFSKPIDPATVTAASVSLRAGQTPVPAQTVVSASRRRVTVSPSSPLAGLTAYTVTLTSGIRDDSGMALAPFQPATFTTLDPSKPPALALGIITAELPDEDGLTLITGAPGAADAGAAVVATNLRSQNTTTVLALADGSFRLRLPVIIGDDVALTFRDASGRETTLTISQFTSSDGTTSIGPAGGTIAGAGGRAARILPRALSSAALFLLREPDSGPGPVLPSSLRVQDRFTLSIDGGSFRRLESLTLTESQNRFTPLTVFAAPFGATGQLTVPADFLVSASLRFTATATDRDGARRSASGATVVVAVGPDRSEAESGIGDSFPTVFLSAPKQAVPSEVVRVSAMAPAARVDLDLPSAAGEAAGDVHVLGRLTLLAGQEKLSLVDRLARTEVNGGARLRTIGRDLPGTSRGGEYVAVSGALAFVTGRAAGPAAVVSINGWPIIAETDGANGAFVLAVPADAPFTLDFTDAVTGAPLGSVPGQAPAAGGSVNLGQLLAAATGALTVVAEPDAQSIVDINAPLVFTFSEPLDLGTVTAGAIVVTEVSGARVFGTVAVSGDARQVAFVPFRRWRFATRYRYGLAASLTAASGARLPETFAGEFTTFTPRLLRSVAAGTAADVAVSAGVAAVATDTGLATLDVASASAARVTGRLPMTGGARGVALLPDTSLVDRTGQLRAGTFAAVATGTAAMDGRLQVVDLTGATPLAIGSAQLTTAPGQTAPANVFGAAGVPNAVALAGDKHALVSITGVGLAAVDVAAAVPADSTAPGRAVLARYPGSGVESVNGASDLGGRILTAGIAGLGVLDANLQRMGGVTTTGNAAAVAALPGFSSDLNGDGVMGADETFDLAVVANGADGTLQFYRVPASGVPVLFTVVRFAENAVGVTLDRTERLAYVSVGTRGVGIVDLDGPASIQPLDDNHDGTDDRILGVLDTPGYAQRAALALERGLGFIADGVGGVAIAQVVPARTRFLDVKRDPFTSQNGDEESIGDGLPARATDDAVVVRLNAVVPDQSSLFLTIVEEPDADGPFRLTFADGSHRVALANGLNTLTLPIAHVPGPQGSRVALVAVNASGAVVARTAFRIESDTIDPGALDALLVTPSVVLGSEDSVFQLVVGGRLRDGRIVNLTTAASGTTYQSMNPLVLETTPDGLVVVRAGGVTNVLVSHGGLFAMVVVTVQRAAVIQAIEIEQPFMTLVRAGERQAIKGFAELTDGSQDSLVAAGATFESSDPAVVTVDAAGVVSAVAQGSAVVTVRLGTIAAPIRVAVELRTPPVLTGIDLAAFAAPVLTTDARAEARATVTGSGSLEGIDVQFSSPGLPTATGRTDHDGVAIAVVKGLSAAGVATITAAVINPADGGQLSDSESVTVERAGIDAEPNDTVAAATKVKLEVPVGGGLGGADLKDVFRSDAKTAGTASVLLTFADGTDLSQVRVVFLDAAGNELARVTPTGLSERFTQAIGAGPGFVSVESLGAAFTYQASFRFSQAALAIANVVPLNGGPGTAVTIQGAGFSTDPSDVRVLFGGIPGRVVSSSPAQIQALVPAAGKDGPVTVIVTSRRVVGPQFVVGNAAPRPPITSPPVNPVSLRLDPVTGQILDVTRLRVFVDPLTTRAQLDAFAQSLGGSVVGENVVLGAYVLEFTGNGTLAGLATLQRQVDASPLVRYSTLVVMEDPVAIRIDLRDAGWTLGAVKAGVAYSQAQIFAAIEAIRNSPLYSQFGATFQPVGIAVVDTGFNPAALDDFITADGQKVVRLFTPAPATGTLVETGSYVDTHAKSHGTAVTSIIGALNNGGTSPMSGGYGGLFQTGEASFEISVYAPFNGATQKFDGVTDAIAEIADRGDIDILNLSLGSLWDGVGAGFNASKAAYRDAFALLGGKTLVVAAAGNESADAALHLPSALATELPYVIAVGATAVANLDGTGEGADSRADFTNVGDAVTLAAPGEDIFASFSVASGKGPFGSFRGTSGAAPVTSAIAALLQAIRPAGTPLDPDLIRTMLIDSGDPLPDSTALWQRSSPLTRVNALNAVRLLLPPSDPQMIYVADGDEAGIGHIIGIDVDPTTGKRPTPPNPDVVIPLTVTKETDDGSATAAGRKPTTLLVAPTGDELFALVDSDAYGASLLVVNTISNRPVDFIPLSGVGFPSVASGTPLTLSSLKPPMVFSKDGRLLYVGAGSGLVLVNAVTHRVVTVGSDLPGEYNGLPAATPNLAARLAAIGQAVKAGINTTSGNRPGQFISALALSPDGRILYAAVHTGGGAGHQPGGLLAINVDLYTDAAPAAAGLQTDLSRYLELITPQPVGQIAAGGFLGGDEPQAVGVAPDGRSVYLVNGGLNFFEAVPLSQLDLVKYQDLLLGPALTMAGAAGGVEGVNSAITSFATTSSSLSDALRRDLAEQADSGLTFVGAPGVTGVFDVTTDGSTAPLQSWVYPSDVGYGWNPTPDNGGSVINHTRFRDVFAKRPFGFALDPDGRRALLPMFQTGNFGVLDLDFQAGFENPPGATPKAGISALSDSMFQGLVGATEALRFDLNLWPRRGAFTSGSTFMPSPDENFMYPWAVEYAQNGRWAAAVHVGARAPGEYSAVVPNDATALRLMTELSQAERDGSTPATGQTFTVHRGGGGLSIIDDAQLSTDLNVVSTQSVFSTQNNTTRPYLSTLPACGPRAPDETGAVKSSCTTQTVGYQPEGGATRFYRPRGVTIQPFLAIQGPRHGDHVSLSTAIQFAWRDTRVGKVTFRFLELPPPGVNADPADISGPILRIVSATLRSRRYAGAAIETLLDGTNVQLVEGTRYRIEVRVLADDGSFISKSHVDVVFEALGETAADPASLTLTPFIAPAVGVPATQQLTALFEAANTSAEQNVTADGEVTYLWIQGLDQNPPIIGSTAPALNLTMNLLGDQVKPFVEGLINDIKSKLSANGTEVPVALAKVQVSPTGLLTIEEAGVNLVQAVYRKDGVYTFSNPVVVLAGLQLSKIDLEPDSLLNTAASLTGAETLGKKIATKLGTKANTPLVLTANPPAGFSFLEQTGNIELNDVEFTYLGQGTISLQQLMKSLETLITKQMRKAIAKRLPGNPLLGTIGLLAAPALAKGMVSLVEAGITGATVQFVDFESSDDAVATVENGTGFSKGEVTGVSPGIIAVKGTLDLGRFGSADDKVPVFVLPQLTSAVMDPINVAFCRADSPEPGRKVRTLATAKFAPHITIDPSSFGASQDVGLFLEAFLPQILPVGQAFDIPIRVGDFEVHFQGLVTVEGNMVVWDDPALVFTVPNITGVTNRYEFTDDPAIARVGEPRDVFSVRLLHQGAAGRSRITNFVTVPILGSVEAIGSITVTDVCNTPFVTKILADGSVQTVEPGGTAAYVVTAANPTSNTLTNVRVIDTATFVASQPTGDPSLDVVEVEQIFQVGTLEPHTFIDVPVSVPALSGFTGLLSNRARVEGDSEGTGQVTFQNVTPCQVNQSAPGCTSQTPQQDEAETVVPYCKQIPTPSDCIGPPPPLPVVEAAPLITELVLSPTRDWNDSAGGSGVAFDGVPGDGIVDGNDVYVEVTAVTAWAGFTITLTDATGATFSQVIPAPSTGGVQVISGFGVGASAIVRVEVTDTLGLIRQVLDITAIENALGPATGADDESLSWSIFGSPTPTMQQFLRRAASPGLFTAY